MVFMDVAPPSNKRRAEIKREYENKEFNRVRGALRQMVDETRIAADLTEFLVLHGAPQNLIVFVSQNLKRLAWDLNAVGAGTEPRDE